MMPEINAAVVGTKHKGPAALDALARMNEGDAVRLAREPSNPYDPNAVQVHFLGVFVGYVPKVANPMLAAAMDAGAQPIAIVRKAPVLRGRWIQVEPVLRIAWRD